MPLNKELADSLPPRLAEKVHAIIHDPALDDSAKRGKVHWLIHGGLSEDNENYLRSLGWDADGFRLMPLLSAARLRYLMDYADLPEDEKKAEIKRLMAEAAVLERRERRALYPGAPQALTDEDLRYLALTGVLEKSANNLPPALGLKLHAVINDRKIDEQKRWELSGDLARGGLTGEDFGMLKDLTGYDKGRINDYLSEPLGEFTQIRFILHDDRLSAAGKEQKLRNMITAAEARYKEMLRERRGDNALFALFAALPVLVVVAIPVMVRIFGKAETWQKWKYRLAVFAIAVSLLYGGFLLLAVQSIPRGGG